MKFNKKYEFKEMLRFAEQKHFCNDFDYAQSVYKQASQLYPGNPIPHVRIGQLLIAKNKPEEALSHLLDHETKVEADADFNFIKGKCYQLLGKDQKAGQAFDACLQLKPDYIEVHQIMSTQTLSGPNYRSVLSDLHKAIQPEVYLEIGIERGNTLRLAKSSDVVIGVDPKPLLDSELTESFAIFRMTSDAFFSKSKHLDLLSSKPPQMSFIDGLHEFSQVLRDFINVEKVSLRSSVVVLHDVIPLNAATSTKERETMFWSGDVWKILPALQDLCPGLNIEVLASPPTGLALITNLAPGRQLKDRTIARAIKKFDNLDFPRFESEYKAAMKIRTDIEQVLEQLPEKRKVDA